MTALQSYIVSGFNGSENQFFTDHPELSAPADVSCLQGSGLTPEEIELVSYLPAVLLHLDSVCPGFHHACDYQDYPCSDPVFIEELFRYYRYLFLVLSVIEDYPNFDFSSFFPTLPKFCLCPSHWEHYESVEDPPLYFSCSGMYASFMGCILSCYSELYYCYRATGSLVLDDSLDGPMTQLQKYRESLTGLATQGGATDVAT
jgi:hypothetical protein